MPTGGCCGRRGSGTHVRDCREPILPLSLARLPRGRTEGFIETPIIFRNVVAGDDTAAVFNVAGGATFTVRNLTIADGILGINNLGTTIVTGSTFLSNGIITGPGTSGGAIFNAGRNSNDWAANEREAGAQRGSQAPMVQPGNGCGSGQGTPVSAQMQLVQNSVPPPAEQSLAWPNAGEQAE